MTALDAHLATFIAERDYNKRDYDVAKLTEAVLKGNELLSELSNELGR